MEPQGPTLTWGGPRLVRIVLAVVAAAVVVSIVTLPGYGVVAILISNSLFVAVGALISRRHPGNVIGPLAMGHGGGIMVLVSLNQVGLRLADNGSTKSAGAVALVAATLFPAIAMLTVPLFLAFPDRILPTTAARWYLSLVALRSLAEREDAARLQEMIDGLIDDAQHAVDDLRRVAHGIYPPLLATEGLAVALGALHTPVAVDLRPRGGTSA